jgi:alcohol dehydrogenase class IV
MSSFRRTEQYVILKRILIESGMNLIQEIRVDQNPAWDSLSRFGNIKNNVDNILCVGGGSVIDFGKALKLYFHKNTRIFAIYTLPGSASIVTPFVIFDNDEFKIGKHSEEIVPDYVYINEKILLRAPINLIRMGTFDILAHIIESFLSTAATRESRSYALKAHKFLVDYNESGLTDVFSLIRADIFAGLSERVGLVLFPHAAGHYLTYKYKIPHSLATMYFLEKFITLLQSSGLVIPQEMRRQINTLNAIFIKDYKKLLSLTSGDIKKSYSMARKYMPFIFTNNPVPLTKGDYLAQYQEYENYE